MIVEWHYPLEENKIPEELEPFRLLNFIIKKINVIGTKLHRKRFTKTIRSLILKEQKWD